MIQVGKPAPDFTAAAYYQGKFVNTSLSEYKGKWVLLCFYSVILPLFELLKFQQLLKSIRNFKLRGRSSFRQCG